MGLTIMGRADPPRTMKCRLAPDRSLTPTLSQRARGRTCSANFMLSSGPFACFVVSDCPNAPRSHTGHKVGRPYPLIASLVLMLVTGCASTPDANFYTLSAVSPQTARSSQLSVAVGPVVVPAAVDRPEIVVTTGPNQVRLEEFHRWASPVQDEIARAVAENLSGLLGTGHVTLAQRALDADARYQVAIEVQRLESVLGQSATVDAFWTVRRAAEGRSRAGRTIAREAPAQPTHEALVAAHSRAIERLSRDIAEAIRGLE